MLQMKRGARSAGVDDYFPVRECEIGPIGRTDMAIEAKRGRSVWGVVRRHCSEGPPRGPHTAEADLEGALIWARGYPGEGRVGKRELPPAKGLELEKGVRCGFNARIRMAGVGNEHCKEGRAGRGDRVRAGRELLHYLAGNLGHVYAEVRGF
jgi:hypothetical protein